MRGDVILVEEHHRRAAEKIVAHLLEAVKATEGRYTMTVAGESGSGKSESAQAIAEEFAKHGINAAIYQQDDYFELPPKSNDAKRRQDIGWVGTQEVKLELLDEHLAAALAGVDAVEKPLVVYEDDAVEQEVMNIADAKVVIAEGTYTTLLQNATARVFINRNRLETMAAREKRGREEMDPFIERVLEIEHAIISKHKERADIIITRDYDVEF